MKRAGGWRKLVAIVGVPLISAYIEVNVALGQAFIGAEALPVERIDSLPDSTVPSLDIDLGIRESDAAQLSEDWRNRYVPARLGRNGQIVYHFGQSIASIVASPTNVTDIILQKNERIVEGGIFVGNTVDWEVTPLVQEQGNAVFSHIIVKPRYPNVETTMTVFTDKRTYYFALISTLGEFMTNVGFEYSSDLDESTHEYRARLVAHEEKNADLKKAVPEISVPQPAGGTKQVPYDDLDFNYEVVVTKGRSPRWKPIRVFSADNKTYIQLPARVRYGDAPVFLLNNGNNDHEIVNYRLQNDTYVVDGIFEQSLLIAGVGRNQTVVEIRYTGELR